MLHLYGGVDTCYTSQSSVKQFTVEIVNAEAMHTLFIEADSSDVQSINNQNGVYLFNTTEATVSATFKIMKSPEEFVYKEATYRMLASIRITGISYG